MAALADRMSEAELEVAVRDLLRTLGIWGYHAYDSRRSEPGWVDWTILGTKALFRELKSQEGVLSAPQSRVRNLLLASGQDWDIWRPADLVSGRIAEELRAIRM